MKMNPGTKLGVRFLGLFSVLFGSGFCWMVINSIFQEFRKVDTEYGFILVTMALSIATGMLAILGLLFLFTPNKTFYLMKK